MKTNFEKETEKMENKTINTQNLEAVTGSKKYSANWNIGEKVSISSAMPQCPDCGKPLLSGGNYPERGYDIFKCKCGLYYAHFYVGDVWYRAYMIL